MTIQRCKCGSQSAIWHDAGLKPAQILLVDGVPAFKYINYNKKHTVGHIFENIWISVSAWHQR